MRINDEVEKTKCDSCLNKNQCNIWDEFCYGQYELDPDAVFDDDIHIRIEPLKEYRLSGDDCD